MDHTQNTISLSVISESAALFGVIGQDSIDPHVSVSTIPNCEGFHDARAFTPAWFNL